MHGIFVVLEYCNVPHLYTELIKIVEQSKHLKYFKKYECSKIDFTTGISNQDSLSANQIVLLESSIPCPCSECPRSLVHLYVVTINSKIGQYFLDIEYSCRKMAERTLPLLFVNLGGEMLYVLDQRLRAQVLLLFTM